VHAETGQTLHDNAEFDTRLKLEFDDAPSRLDQLLQLRLPRRFPRSLPLRRLLLQALAL
jgi:hypothetical protein